MNNSSLRLLFLSTGTHLLVHLQLFAAAAKDHLVGVVNDDDDDDDDDDDEIVEMIMMKRPQCGRRPPAI